MVQTLIIDDEAHIRDSLKKILARHFPQVQIAGEADSVTSGVKAIHDIHPDLVLLDIQMADGNGFDLLNALPSIDFKIIFITAYDRYALQAFRFSAVDYLLKPVNPEALADAVNRAVQLVRAHHDLQMEALKDNLKNIDKSQKKIILKTAENVYLLNLKDVISCEGDDNYTSIFTTSGEKILVSRTLKEYDEMLSGYGFFRVHKSHLINLAHIRRFEKQEGGYIILTNDLKVPVASRKRDEIVGIMEKMAE